MTYITRDREAGNIIDEFKSLADAEAAIKRYEAEDQKQGVYEADFYEIAAVDSNGNEVEL